MAQRSPGIGGIGFALRRRFAADHLGSARSVDFLAGTPEN